MAAFEQLVRRYEHRVYGFALRCGGNPAEASEVTQETFVKAYQALAGFDARRGFKPWLLTIARRKIIDRYRVAEPAPAELPELIELDNPAEQLARHDDRVEIWRLAELHLPAVQYQVLWLHYVEDLSVRDIARVLQRTATHVKVLLFRARKTLARHLLSRVGFTPLSGQRRNAPALGRGNVCFAVTAPKLAVPSSSGFAAPEDGRTPAI